jgi:hypothetical protein
MHLHILVLVIITFRINVIRHVTAVLFADPRLQIIFAGNCSATFSAAARTREGTHVVHTKRGVLHRDLFVFFDVSFRDHIQADEPRVRVAAVIDWSPLERVVAPYAPHLVRVGIGVRSEPRFLLCVPLLVTGNGGNIINNHSGICE